MNPQDPEHNPKPAPAPGNVVMPGGVTPQPAPSATPEPASVAGASPAPDPSPTMPAPSAMPQPEAEPTIPAPGQTVTEAVGAGGGSSSRILLVALIAFVVLIGVGGYLAWSHHHSKPTNTSNTTSARSVENNPSAVATKMLQDISDGNFAAAYGLTSSGFKAKNTLAVFTKAVSSLNVKPAAITVSSSITNQTIVVVSGKIKFSSSVNSTTDNFSMRTVKQGGLWYVDNLFATFAS